jgi:DNA ligase 1
MDERRRTLHDSFSEEKGFFEFAKFKNAEDVALIEDFLQESVNDHCEGLMVKTLEDNSTYEPAKRSLNWLKVKKDYIGTQLGDSLDLVVVGADYGTGKRTGFYGSFLIASFDEDHR